MITITGECGNAISGNAETVIKKQDGDNIKLEEVVVGDKVIANGINRTTRILTVVSVV